MNAFRVAGSVFLNLMDVTLQIFLLLCFPFIEEFRGCCMWHLAYLKQSQ